MLSFLQPAGADLVLVLATGITPDFLFVFVRFERMQSHKKPLKYRVQLRTQPNNHVAIQEQSDIHVRPLDVASCVDGSATATFDGSLSVSIV
jgi:hypothetical protein